MDDCEIIHVFLCSFYSALGMTAFIIRYEYFVSNVIYVLIYFSIPLIYTVLRFYISGDDYTFIQYIYPFTHTVSITQTTIIYVQPQPIPNEITHTMNRIIETNLSTYISSDDTHDDECIICYDNLHHEHTVVNACDLHQFHTECMKEYLKNSYIQNSRNFENFVCPVCKREIRY